MSTFRAVAASEAGPASLVEHTDADLGEGDVTVAVAYSSLNYKDGLAVTGKGKIVRSYPMIAGIDLAGVVEASDSPDWKPGDEVLVTGWGLSETRSGGFTQRQRVRSEWLTRRPDGLTLQQTMAVGTAGLTAMLCVLAIEGAGVVAGRRRGRRHRRGRRRRQRRRGRAGGARLRRWPRRPAGPRPTTTSARSAPPPSSTATELATGRPAARQGALARRRRHRRQPDPGHRARPDPVRRGGRRVRAGRRQRPARRRSCPFILRNVALLGVDSVMCPAPVRDEAWARLGTDLPTDLLDAMTTVRPLTDVPELAEQILAGQTRGRVVIDTSA